MRIVRTAIVFTLLALGADVGAAAAQESFPNVSLRTQSGVPVRFYDDLIKGKVVLINFFFTSCTTICPRTTDNLVKVEEALGERLGRDVAMISISVDPDTDTPTVLAKYALRYRTKPGWYFVTGSLKDIDLIRRRLGVNRDGGDKSQHTGVLVYGNDATGQWAATPAMADPQAIVRSVLRLVKPGASTALRLVPRKSSSSG
jgi:protein SCO1/2